MALYYYGTTLLCYYVTVTTWLPTSRPANRSRSVFESTRFLPFTPIKPLLMTDYPGPIFEQAGLHPRPQEVDVFLAMDEHGAGVRGRSGSRQLAWTSRNVSPAEPPDGPGEVLDVHTARVPSVCLDLARLCAIAITLVWRVLLGITDFRPTACAQSEERNVRLVGRLRVLHPIY